MTLMSEDDMRIVVGLMLGESMTSCRWVVVGFVDGGGGGAGVIVSTSWS